MCTADLFAPFGRAGLKLAAVLALASGAAASHAADYTLDPGHTFVHWEVLHMGTSTTRGRFDKAAGAVSFDGAARRIDASITVDTASVSTGLQAFDNVLRGAPLLAAKDHPQAFFTARQALWNGDAPQALQGEFTLRGISQPLTLTAVRWKCGLNLLFQREVCGGDFEASIKRSDFGMTLALPLVGDTVRLLIQIEAVRNP